MRRLLVFLGLAGVFACGPAWADFVPIPIPTAAYISGTTLVPFLDPDNTVISSLTSGPQTLSYSSPITEYTVPATWYIWNSPPFVETSTPRVGDTYPATSLTITLSMPADTFGFELEPDLFEVEEITAQFFTSGGLAGTIDQFVNGDGGALLFAATTSTSPFTSVTITDTVDDDFAIAQQRYGPTIVPEPSSGVLLASVLAALGTVLRLRRG
jgi:hypothetical protein